MNAPARPIAPVRQPRLKLFQPTEMVVAGVTQRVHVLNVSLTGALVHGATPPVANARLTLRCDTVMREAKVAWVDGRRFGIVFTTPLSDALMRAMIAPAAKT